jgi:RHS repeat-associated protein
VTYNAENRPTLFSNDTTVVEMAYDYMGRRFEYKETVSGTLTRHECYLYRGYLQIAALDMLNSASVKHTIIWDPTERIATRPLVLRTGTAAYYYSFDQVKNVTELFDSTGVLAATYDYSPFGLITSELSVGSSAFDVSSNPLTFSSEIIDCTLGLQYYNYRHLNLLDGRWVNREPIGEECGSNLNIFVDNDPIGANDFLGLFFGGPPYKIENPGADGLSKADWYNLVVLFGNMAPGVPQKLLRHYIFDNGETYKLTKNEALEIDPITNLKKNGIFNGDLSSARLKSILKKGMVEFDGTYRLESGAGLNGTLGNFTTLTTVKVIVCVQEGNAMWSAAGTATFYDVWDFNLEWGAFIAGQLGWGSGNRRSWFGQLRTQVGWFIPGSEFQVESEKLEASQFNFEDTMRFK